MASVTKSLRAAAGYIPTPDQIAAACDEIHQRRLEAFDEGRSLQPARVNTRGRKKSLAVTEEEQRAKDRLRARRNLARAKAARLQLADSANSIELANRQLHQHDEPEPIDVDHRDPRQTEQWLPVPAIEPDAAEDAALTFNEWQRMSPRDRRRWDAQERWDARREHNRLAAEADARGVLNYYNVNRGPRAPLFEVEQPLRAMERKDIANVEFLNMGDLDAVLADLVDVAETQQEIEDLGCRWSVGPNACEAPQTTRDVVSFRSKRR